MRAIAGRVWGFGMAGLGAGPRCRAWVAAAMAVAVEVSAGLAWAVGSRVGWCVVLCTGFAAAGARAARVPSVNGRELWRAMVAPVGLLVVVGGMAVATLDGWRLVTAVVGAVAVTAPLVVPHRAGVPVGVDDVAVAATLGVVVGAADLVAVVAVAGVGVMVAFAQVVAARRCGRRSVRVRG